MAKCPTSKNSGEFSTSILGFSVHPVYEGASAWVHLISDVLASRGSIHLVPPLTNWERGRRSVGWEEKEAEMEEDRLCERRDGWERFN